MSSVVVPTVTLLVGFAAGVAVVDNIARRLPSRKAAGYRARCLPSILFLKTGRGAVSIAIDTASGNLGFSHLIVDGCEIDENGKPLVIDVDRGHGVVRRPLLEATEGRRYVRVYLPLDVGAQLLGCVRSRIGESYSAKAMVVGTHEGNTCASIIQRCLPDHLQIPAPTGRPLAPNDFARAWGITANGPSVIDLSRNLG